MSPRKKKIYYTIISVVGIALIVDRLFLGTGGPDAANAIQIIVDAPAAELAEEEDNTVMAIPELHFPSGLPAYHPWLMSRDFFAPPALSSALHGDGKAGNSNTPQNIFLKTGKMTRARFKSDVKLNGIIVQQGLQIAVVDGQWLRVGQSHNGCTLEKVSGNKADFECVDGSVTIHVNRHSDNGSD